MISKKIQNLLLIIILRRTKLRKALIEKLLVSFGIFAQIIFGFTDILKLCNTLEPAKRKIQDFETKKDEFKECFTTHLVNFTYYTTNQIYIAETI